MSELENLDWPKVVSHLTGYATSGGAQDHLRKISPLSTQEEAEQNFAIITEVKNILSQGERPFMESLDIFHTWFHRLEKQSQLKPLELKDARLFFIEAHTLFTIVEQHQGEWSKGLLKQSMDVKSPLSAIDHLITPQAEIRTDASETLHKLYNEKQSQSKKIQNALNRVVKEHENETALQDKFVTNREGRWVVPVKSGMRHDIPGIIHATSNSKQTVFIEPQDVVPLNNELKKIEAAIEEEIELLLDQLSTYLHGLINDIQNTRELLLQADIQFAQSQFCSTLDAHAPQFSTSAVDLVEVKHPLMVINGEDVIPNTIFLNNDERILLLSGPNAGGKTVLLKSFGLAAQMARCGLPICAKKGSKIPFFKSVTSAVGDAQSVDSQLSTFVGHLTTLNEACAVSGPQALVLVDEICGSTDPEEGSALARGFIQHYAKQEVFSVITSHLGPLKSGWSSDSGVINGSMEYNRETGTSTYHFIKGVPGQSLAFSTAKRIGIDKSVFEAAQNYLSPETRKRFETIEDIERAKDKITQLRTNLEKKIQETQKEKVELQKRIVEFENDRDEKLKVEVQSIKEKLLEEAQKKNIQKVFSDHERRSKIEVDFPEVVKFTQNKEEPDLTLEKFVKAYPPGSIIYAPTLKRDAIIQGAPNKQGHIPILAGSMRLLVPWAELKPPKKAVNPLTKRNFNSNVVVEMSDRGENIDLRGSNVNKAIEDLEIFLDSAIGARYERVKILHGHGSEALKKSIRSHLSRSVYVNRWASSIAANGDDGTTIAYIALD